jgi:regulator of replication initiation timing
MEQSDDIINDLTRSLNEGIDEGNKLKKQIESLIAYNTALEKEKLSLSETLQGKHQI